MNQARSGHAIHRPIRCCCPAYTMMPLEALDCIVQTTDMFFDNFEMVGIVLHVRIQSS